MDSALLDSIAFRADVAQLQKRLRLEPDSDEAAELGRLIAEAEAIARPKAYYLAAFVESREDSGVNIEGVAFSSRVLSVNIAEAHRVFPYVVTCGTELEEWSERIDDVLMSYWADALKEAALRSAFQTMERHMDDVFRLGKTARMNPGSLADWPINQQRPLFDLLGKVTENTGVQLTESYLMLPIKSVSGIRFPTESSFESCQLCPRDLCPGRRAPYDVSLFDRRYR